MLGLRHPDKKFEVVNAAMTAINSHVILPLARDEGDRSGYPRSLPMQSRRSILETSSF